jgi:hypothetical protein
VGWSYKFLELCIPKPLGTRARLHWECVCSLGRNGDLRPSHGIYLDLGRQVYTLDALAAFGDAFGGLGESKEMPWRTVLVHYREMRSWVLRSGIGSCTKRWVRDEPRKLSIAGRMSCDRVSRCPLV